METAKAMATTEERRKGAQTRILMGAGLVLLGCTFGGLIAIVLHLLGQRSAAGAAAIVAGVVGLVGVVMQVMGYVALQKLKKETP